MTFINADTNTLNLNLDGVNIGMPPGAVLNLELSGGSLFTTPDGMVRTNSPGGVCSFTVSTSSFVPGFDWQGQGVNAFLTGLTHGSILAGTILAIYGVRWVFGWLEEDDRWE